MFSHSRNYSQEAKVALDVHRDLGYETAGVTRDAQGVGRQNEIEREMSDLCGAVEYVAMEVAELVSRLAPVSRSENPHTVSDKASRESAPISTPLGAKLHETTGRLRAITDALNSARSRLELP